MWRVSVLPSIPASNTISAKSPVSTVSSADTSDSNLPSTSHCVVCVCVLKSIFFHTALSAIPRVLFHH